jgi:hypothetical protein
VKETASSQPTHGALDRAEWDRLWEEHFVKPGLADPEQEFLAESRSPEAEKARLERIQPSSRPRSNGCTTSGPP